MVIQWLKRHLSLVLVIVLILVSTWTISLFHKNHYLNSKIVEQTSTFKTWTDSMGRTHAKMKEQDLFISQLTTESHTKIDGVAHLLKVQPRDITKVVTESSRTTGHFTLIPGASIHSYTFSDSHLVLSGSDSDKSIVGTYVYTDTGNIVFYTKSTKFLGITFHRDPYLDVYFSNPNTRIENLSNISLKQYTKPRKWGIGPSVGVTFNGTAIKPYIGVGLNYNLIRW